MSSDRIPMSKEGYEKLKAKLDQYKNEDMPRIAEQIAQARGYGDLSENAEFDAAVEAQGMLQARINELQNKLSQAFLVDTSNLFNRPRRLRTQDHRPRPRLQRGGRLYPRRPRRGRS